MVNKRLKYILCMLSTVFMIWLGVQVYQYLTDVEDAKCKVKSGQQLRP